MNRRCESAQQNEANSARTVAKAGDKIKHVVVVVVVVAVVT